ncbi:MAG TPA: energy transducer TonB [Candidatus Acidoferrum sp.]|nr:energy transducer TonB [Candidatus Acidoferrum sp.]
MALGSMVHQLIEVPAPPKPEKESAEARLDYGSYAASFDLSGSLLEANHMKRPRSALDVLISVVLHLVLIGTPVLLSLWFTNTLDLKAFTKTMLIAPPPPPPPPPAPSVVRPVAPQKRVFLDQGKLLAPSYVPKQVAMLKEAPLPDDGGAGVLGGVPGGVPGGQMGGVLGGIIGGTGTAPGPASPKPKAPVRVGGRVQAPRAMFTPAPEYPSIARSARIQGVVVISAILDEQGNVVEMKIVSGPVLLYQSALSAVSRWKYQPTYLNGEPISVEMNILVTFQLSGV